MTARFDAVATNLEGLTVLIRRPIVDRRGFLERVFCSDELAPWIAGRRIEQINRTVTRMRGTARGLHFQLPPHAETKFVSCLRGAVYDVAVDLRRGSPTFLRWHGRILSGDNRETLLIREGFAHGFQTLEDDCEMLYLHTAHYAPGSERGLNLQDPTIGIAWPEKITDRSDRDAGLPFVSDDFQGITR